MAKAYEAASVEDKWYSFWMEKGYFKPVINPRKKPFTIIMPPPNVTGELHVGHALTATIEDIMVRWHRMKGDPTLWVLESTIRVLLLRLWWKGCWPKKS